jgi:hypothetical protein
MLCGDNLARLRLELWTDLATPRAGFEGLSQPLRPLDRDLIQLNRITV